MPPRFDREKSGGREFSRNSKNVKKAVMKTVMADNFNFKMYHLTFLLSIILSCLISCSAANGKEEKCSCHDVCEKNFTTNSIKDVQKILACQRGCRFYSLVFHTSHEPNLLKSAIHAKEGCMLSCTESYINPFEVSACNYGCTAIESSKISCNIVENQIPQISYSFMIEESDVLIHPGEPEPDDSLTDPGLRKQFQKTLAALLDATPKIPEIHFRNLPIKTEKLSDITHANFKCPKFYGFDSKFEFRNGKIIIGDLYLFVGVFIFVVICFILGHHIETKNMAKQLMETRLPKKEDTADREPLLKIEIEQEDLNEKDVLPNFVIKKSEILEPNMNGPESKFDSITLVFHDEDTAKDNEKEENNIKI